jgi:AAA domain
VYATQHPELGLTEKWHGEHPDWNCGVAAQPETPYFNVDSDDLDALHAEWAQFSDGQLFPQTLFVYSRTDEHGKRRGHYHFLKTDYSNQKLGHVKNRGLAPQGDLRNQMAELQYMSGQCIWAGSIHSKTGKPLVIEADMPMQPVPNRFVDFLASLPKSTRLKNSKATVGDRGRFEELTDDDLAEMGANSGRHQYLDSYAGRYCNGDAFELEELLKEVNEKFAEPVEDDYCERLAADFANREPASKHWYNVGLWFTTDKKQYEERLAEKGIAVPVVEPPEANDNVGNVDPESWPTLFHTYDEAINAPPLSFAIEGFIQENGITFFGSLPGHSKTLTMLNVAKSLIEGDDLFGHPAFKVTKTAKRVIYLIPESGLGPFVHRLKVFRLLDHVKSGRLYFRTLSAREPLKLDDPRLLKAAEGSDVFLDTAVRFMLGEENSASDHRQFADILFNLQRVGARTIIGAHHSPKAFEGKESISLENAFRGSGDVGAMLATAWALKQTDAATNRVYIKNVKPRDFEPCQPFEIEGRPWIDQTGSFRMVTEPGMARTPATKQDKPEIIQAKLLRQAGKSLAEIAQQLGVADRTVERWSSAGKLA